MDLEDSRSLIVPQVETPIPALISTPVEPDPTDPTPPLPTGATALPSTALETASSQLMMAPR